MSWAFSNLIYNQIAIVVQSHNLSTFPSLPQLCPNISENRINRCRLSPWTFWILEILVKKEGKMEETAWELEGLRCKKNHNQFLITMERKVHKIFTSDSAQTDKISCQLCLTLSSFRQVLQNDWLGPTS